jgi:hypothetical protein
MLCEQTMDEEKEEEDLGLAVGDLLLRFHVGNCSLT